MSRVIVDTNVLVSFLTDRDEAQQAQAATLFEATARGEVELIVHQMVISEMVYVLGNLYHVAAAEIARMIGDLLSAPGVTSVDGVLWARVLELWPARFADFADATLATATLEGNYDAVATFDRRFIRQLEREGQASYWASGDDGSADDPQGSPSEVGSSQL